MIYKLLVLFSIFGASCAQMSLKRAARQHYTPFWRQYLNVWVVGGYAILLGSLLLNVFCMSQGVLLKELSVIESSSLLFVPLLSRAFFREAISWKKGVSIGLVMAGAVIFFS